MEQSNIVVESTEATLQVSDEWTITFKKYSEIENSYREKAINEIQVMPCYKGTWVVTEKIHGSNITFYTNGRDIKMAKRTSILSEEEALKFFNCNGVKAKYEKSIFHAFELVKAMNPELKTLRIHGEIFGGVYPHKSVPKQTGAMKVQSGVYYCPHNDFFAFDLHDGTKYLDYDIAVKIFQEAKFFYAEPLFIGTLEEALKYPNTFQTTIPSKFGLPEISNNTAEGVVIKPNVAALFNSGARVILKNKTEKFLEKIGVKPLEPKQLKVKKYPEEVETLRAELISYVTETRLDNVISKIGQVTIADTQTLIALFSKDALEDFMKDFGLRYDVIEPSHQKYLTKSLGNASVHIVKLYFRKNT